MFDPITDNTFNKYNLDNFTASYSKFYFNPISIPQVQKRLRQIPTGKAFGLDEINGRFLKSGANVLAKPLTNIFASYPTKWNCT